MLAEEQRVEASGPLEALGQMVFWVLKVGGLVYKRALIDPTAIIWGYSQVLFWVGGKVPKA